MKRKLAVTMMMCCMAALAAAQDHDSMKNDSMKNGKMKGDKTVMGCVRSNNGMYMLEESNGKMAMLTGPTDFSQHIGHMITAHGMWQKSDMGMGHDSMKHDSMSADKMADDKAGMNQGGSGNMSDNMKKMKWAHKGESFMANSVDMKSSTCDMPMKNKN